MNYIPKWLKLRDRIKIEEDLTKAQIEKEKTKLNGEASEDKLVEEIDFIKAYPDKRTTLKGDDIAVTATQLSNEAAEPMKETSPKVTKPASIPIMIGKKPVQNLFTSMEKLKFGLEQQFLELKEKSEIEQIEFRNE